MSVAAPRAIELVTLIVIVVPEVALAATAVAPLPEATSVSLPGEEVSALAAERRRYRA
jgi:hypothetical protein